MLLFVVAKVSYHHYYMNSRYFSRSCSLTEEKLSTGQEILSQDIGTACRGTAHERCLICNARGRAYVSTYVRRTRGAQHDPTGRPLPLLLHASTNHQSVYPVRTTRGRKTRGPNVSFLGHRTRTWFPTRF